MAVAALAFSAVFAVSTKASCGLSTTPRLAILWPESQLVQAQAAMQQSSEPDKQDASIVGLWSVTLYSGGQVFEQAFDQWHSDGTEISDDNAPPDPPNSTGTFCMGVFKKTGPRTYKLKHPAWIFDANAILVGTGVLLEQVIVDKSGNSYSGSVSDLTYDLNGNLISEVDGTLTAVRITPD